MVDATGEWVVMQLQHFSNHDPNFPTSQGNLNGEGQDETEDEADSCSVNGDSSACTIDYRSGVLSEEVGLPPVQVLNESMAPSLVYNTQRGYPNTVIDVKLRLNPEQGVELGQYIGFVLFIEGEKTASFTFARDATAGEIGRYRYLWDGRDAQGRRLPPGMYGYEAVLTVPYRAQYCGTTTGQFGGPPDCVNRPTGRYTEATGPCASAARSC